MQKNANMAWSIDYFVQLPGETCLLSPRIPRYLHAVISCTLLIKVIYTGMCSTSGRTASNKTKIVYIAGGRCIISPNYRPVRGGKTGGTEGDYTCPPRGQHQLLLLQESLPAA